MIGHARKLLGKSAGRSFDRLTDEERGGERYRRAGLSALVLAGARGAAFISVLVSIPLLVRYLGPERFGVWAIISALLVMLRLADFGLGSGVTTAVAQSHGREDHRAAHAYVSSAFFMLTAIALGLGILFALASPFVPWARLFNVSSPSAISEVGPAMSVLVACLLISLPLTVVERAQLGYQEGYVAAAWQGVGSIIALAGIVTGVLLEVGLPWLVLALAGGPMVASLANALIWFGRRRDLRPSWQASSPEATRTLLNLGLLFFALDIAVAVAFLSDLLVAAAVFDAAEVTQYAVPWRLFTIVPVLMSIAVMPLWPAYGEAISRGDIRWAKRTLLRTLLIGLAASVSVAGLLVVFGPQIISVWAGPEVQSSFLLRFGMAMWTVLTTLGAAVSMFLNGAGIVRLQVFWSLIMATSKLALSIILAQAIGLAGIILATVIAYTIFLILPYAIVIPRLLRRLETAGIGEVSSAAGPSLTAGRAS